MGALLEQFHAAGIRFETEKAGDLRAFGVLSDELRIAIRAHKPAILAELAAANDDGPGYHWRVTSSQGTETEVMFTSDLTRGEVGALYPSAAVEPICGPRRYATRAEAAELLGLIAFVFAGEADRAEVLPAALADPEAALTCYRTLVEGERRG
jgi:hypothetical protein